MFLWKVGLDASSLLSYKMVWCSCYSYILGALQYNRYCAKKRDLLSLFLWEMA